MSLKSKRDAIRILLQKNADEKAAAAEIKATAEAQNAAMLEEIASFYEPKKSKALEALRRHYKRGKIVFESRRSVPVLEFFTRQKNAYKRRLNSGTPDDLRLLVNELIDPSIFDYTNGRVGGGTPPTKPNLDYYFPRITESAPTATFAREERQQV
jgi:hypothetical protein